VGRGQAFKVDKQVNKYFGLKAYICSITFRVVLHIFCLHAQISADFSCLESWEVVLAMDVR
jgi:hypothetical protein